MFNMKTKSDLQSPQRPAFRLILTILFFMPFMLPAQTIRTYEYIKATRDTVLMNTDHSYFGGELGLGFNFGPTATIVGGPQIETNVAPFNLYDFSIILPTKLFVGYAFKNHHFEGSIGFVQDRVNVSVMDSLGGRAIDYNRSKPYATFTARYFYRFPIKIPRMKMMLGGELGLGYHSKFFQSKPNFTVNDSSYSLGSSSLQGHDFLLMLGITGRMDIKIFKNLTLTLVSTLIGSPMRASEYALNYTLPGGTNHTAQFSSSVLNVNLNVGLKFDFFTHKKRKQTYDKYGIEDPFRDK
jgi:hypothetical protein